MFFQKKTRFSCFKIIVLNVVLTYLSLIYYTFSWDVFDSFKLIKIRLERSDLLKFRSNSGQSTFNASATAKYFVTHQQNIRDLHYYVIIKNIFFVIPLNWIQYFLTWFSDFGGKSCPLAFPSLVFQTRSYKTVAWIMVLY